MTRRAFRLATAAALLLASAPAGAGDAASPASSAPPDAAAAQAPATAAPPAHDASAPAPDDAKARREDIRQLMALTGAGRLGVEIVRQLTSRLRPLVAKAPQSFWDEYLAQVKEEELVERIIPIYERNLSAQDVKDLIAFYKTPAGQHLVRATPIIMQESFADGQAWGQEIARRILQSARAKGFEVKDL
jgi:hypothetical protein